MSAILQHGQPEGPRRWPRMILFGMLMLVVPLALPLGMGFAAMGALLAVKSGSVIYLPAGAALLLAGLALLHGRSAADLVMLALVSLALAAWWIAGIDARSRMLSSLVELSGRTGLLLGLLVIMVAALLFVHWHHPFSGPRGGRGSRRRMYADAPT